MKGRRFVKLGAAALALVITAGGGFALLSQNVAAQGRGGQAPRLEVDPLWPKPFPVEKHWTLGSVTGVAVDAQDHIWVSQSRGRIAPEQRKRTDADAVGQRVLLRRAADPRVRRGGHAAEQLGWTGQGYQWPQNPAGIAVDGKGNVWIAAGGYPAAALDADADRRRRQRAPAAAARPRALGAELAEAHRLAELPRRLPQRRQRAAGLRLPLVPPTRT